MKPNFCITTLLFSAIAFLTSAQADDSLDTLKKEVVTTYSSIAAYTFADAHAKALNLQTAIAAFTKAPSVELQSKAKEAWNIARLPYLQSEVFQSSAKGANSLDSPALTGADTPVGFRGIEWLLWGADESVDTAGEISAAESAKHAKLLRANADLIVTNLAKQAEEWKVGDKENAAAKLAALPTDEALTQIFTNVTLVIDQLRTIRIGKPYETRDQIDESANFSDLTHAELIYSGSGLANVIAGAYVGSDKLPKVQGSGLLQLSSKLDEESGESLKLAINRVMLAFTSFYPPFDRALLAPDDSPARGAIKEMMDALDELSTETAKTAKALGLKAR